MSISTAALLLGGVAAAAEPAQPDAQLQTLRAEVKSLREELQAMKGRAAAAAPAPATAEAAPAPALAELKDRLDELEVKQKDAVVAGDLPGSFRVPGTEISLRLYGFAELNWVHAFRADNSDIDYSTFAPYLPLDGGADAQRKNRDYLTARTSRLGLDAGTPTRFGLLAVKLEGDFNNEPRTGDTAQYGSPRNIVTQQATSSYGFRVRQAYGQFGGLLAGMTWSTFMDVDNYPETVDFNGPIGSTFIRQPQIRYSYPTQTWGTFTVALENSSSYLLDHTGAIVTTSLSRLPDAVLRWDRSFDWGAVSVRAMTQELRIDDGAGATASARGWGAAASVLYKVRDAGDTLTVGVTGGDGIGRYLNYIEGAFYDAAAGKILTERAVGVIAGYQLKAADWVRVNFVGGLTHDFQNDYVDFARANGLDGGRFGINKWVYQGHLGPIFTPMKGVDLGVEGIWAERETWSGAKGSDLRLDFSAKYYIN
ncbi:DcaP family trimeric outer membrane transporter [Anaeromyxobacter diazotrophicus]|uniref:Porin n=1 Tax=Anaeromyxobacter diazotrophicus TaxID=2590199 RepID=A0A7I9VHE6_9BACT|nr:DcaP family trimeric outer membrane transporter [Anaeromyxobacter diazotrophicus]GEJ55765.1 porin [Anaeromyxobacter diazotrophicus]